MVERNLQATLETQSFVAAINAVVVIGAIAAQLDSDAVIPKDAVYEPYEAGEWLRVCRWLCFFGSYVPLGSFVPDLRLQRVTTVLVAVVAVA